jgi:iron complex outermembrane recepter protein
MSTRILVWALAAMPTLLSAQQPTTPDSTGQRGDSLTRPVQLKEITVSASPTREEAPLTAVTISPSVIKQTPATSSWDLLRMTAGVEVHEQGQGPGFAPTASLRGFSSDHSTDMALWVDGVPVNEPINGHAEGYNDWNLLLPQSIHELEVIKGPTSALFGNFAMAGVVNVRTPDRRQGTTGNLAGGSYAWLEGDVLTGFDHERAGGVLALRGLHDGGWRPNSEYNIGQLYGKLVKDVSPAVSVDGGLGLYGTDWNSPGYITTKQFRAGDFDTVANSTDGGHKLRAQERMSVRVVANPSLLWRSTLFSTQSYWQLFLTIPPEGGDAEGSGSQSEEVDQRYGFGLTSALTWSFAHADLTLGLDGRYDNSDYENWFTTNRVQDSAQAIISADQLSGGLFLAAVTNIGPRLQVSVGGRYDVLGTHSTTQGSPETSATHGVFSPKLGAQVQVSRLIDVYGNVSRGFRSPDGTIDDPSLSLITEWAYEAGIRLGSKAVRAGIAGFLMDVSDEQSFNPVTLVSTNGGSSRRQGIEVELQAQVTPAVAFTTYWTFTDAKYQQLITEDGDTLSGERVFNTALYVGTAALEVAPPTSIWRVRVTTNVVGPYTPFDKPVEINPYALLHLSGGVRLGRTQLEVGVRNILDQEYREIQAGNFIAPGQPISVVGTVSYQF